MSLRQRKNAAYHSYMRYVQIHALPLILSLARHLTRVVTTVFNSRAADDDYEKRSEQGAVCIPPLLSTRGSLTHFGPGRAEWRPSLSSTGVTSHVRIGGGPFSRQLHVVPSQKEIDNQKFM